jgi:hypothetical protein
MQLAALATVAHRIRPGAPLPFNVRHADSTLLLARGQVVRDAGHLQALCERGALVDLEELIDARERVARADRRELPGLWRQGLQAVEQALRQPGPATFREALDSACEPVLALVERDPDLAIFQVLRRQAGPGLAYGIQRSIQSALTAWLVAQRLGWEAGESLRAFKAALTMNLSMLELQGAMAQQTTPPTPQQRGELATHPMRSVQMLQAAGVTDADWLRAVLDHHEQEDGGGYPSGRSDVGELASLLRRADVYTSKLAGRGYRSALAADIAGRQMFMQDPGHPMTAALVKEFGVYPPGSTVRLASGEVGIVVQRGASITTPVVACLTDAQGRTLPAPVRRDTADRRHSVVAVVGAPPAAEADGLDRLLALVVA